MNDAIVKIKQSELTKILDATVEAYNLLDEAKAQADEVADKVLKAYRLLEDIPADVSDVIEEDEEESTEKD